MESLIKNTTSQLLSEFQLELPINYNFYPEHADLMPEPVFRSDSYLNQAAHYYGSLAWWTKLWISFVFVGCCAGVGAIGNMMTLWIIVASFAYSIMTMLLYDHYLRGMEAERGIQKHLDDWQGMMQDSVKHLRALEVNLVQSLVALKSLEQSKEQQIDALEHSSKMLSAHCLSVNTAGGLMTEKLHSIYSIFQERLPVSEHKQDSVAKVVVVDQPISQQSIQELIAARTQNLSAIETAKTVLGGRRIK